MGKLELSNISGSRDKVVVQFAEENSVWLLTVSEFFEGYKALLYIDLSRISPWDDSLCRLYMFLKQAWAKGWCLFFL
jgi:hypothetical protein